MIVFNRKLLYWFYPLLLIIAYLQAKAILPPYYEPLTGSITLPFSLVILYLGVFYFLKNHKKIPILGLYFLYTVLTGILYIYNGRPFILYLQDVAYVLSTMLIAYIAVDKSVDREGKFYKILFYAWFICFVIGFYLYFIRPEWYVHAITEKHALSSWKNQLLSEDQILEQFRFGSFTLDSYSISFMSMYMFPMGFNYFLNSIGWKKFFWGLATVLVIAAAVLSMQRVAVICLLFDIFLLFFIGDKNEKKTMVSIILVIIGLIIVFYSYIMDSISITEQIADRFSSEDMGDAINGSRFSQIRGAFAELSNPLMGQGAGSLSGRAREMGLIGVSDCCWVKIICEHGIIGFMFFVYLIYMTLVKALKYRKFYCVEICAIVNILLAMLVSDPLYYQRYIIPFWFMIGIVWKSNCHKVNENTRV